MIKGQDIYACNIAFVMKKCPMNLGHVEACTVIFKPRAESLKIEPSAQPLS